MGSTISPMATLVSGTAVKASTSLVNQFPSVRPQLPSGLAALSVLAASGKSPMVTAAGVAAAAVNAAAASNNSLTPAALASLTAAVSLPTSDATAMLTGGTSTEVTPKVEEKTAGDEKSSTMSLSSGLPMDVKVEQREAEQDEKPAHLTADSKTDDVKAAAGVATPGVDSADGTTTTTLSQLASIANSTTTT